MAEPERLRAAYRQAGPAESGHLSDDQWERLACDEMDPAGKESALDHILSCGECGEVYRGILGLRAEAHTFDPGAPSPERHPVARPAGHWKTLLIGLSAAAAVVVVFIGLRAPVQRGANTPPTTQSPALRQVRHVEPPTLLAPLGSFQGIPDELSWRPAEGARGYIVELLDGDGELLWMSEELATTKASWPKTVTVGPGRYYWRVLAIPAGGGDPVASDLETFDVGVIATPR